MSIQFTFFCFALYPSIFNQEKFYSSSWVFFTDRFAVFGSVSNG